MSTSPHRPYSKGTRAVAASIAAILSAAVAAGLADLLLASGTCLKIFIGKERTEHLEELIRDLRRTRVRMALERSRPVFHEGPVPRLSRRLTALATIVLPAAERGRFAGEWNAELFVHSRFQRALLVIGIWRKLPALAWGLRMHGRRQSI